MFACLLVPEFSVQAVLLSETEETREHLRRSPIAVLDGPSNLPRVFALNESAGNLGMELGMTKMHVEICGGVLLRPRSMEQEDSAQAALLECASRFSPRVESTGPGTAILDLEGTQRLLGTPDTAACKMTLSARKMGLRIRIAIARNPDTALCAASGFPGITIIAAGEEARTLAPLPISLLPAPAGVLDILGGWGIHTFKALAALPTVALVERLGQQGIKLQELAQGKTNRPLKPVEPLPDFVESHEFEEPVETLESLAFMLNRVLQETCDRLSAQSLATNEIRLTLDLEVRQIQGDRRGEQYRHEWKLPVPTQDRTMLLTLIRLDLEQHTFAAPIKRLTLEAVPIRPRIAQGNLFAPPSPEVEKLEITLARIRGVVGTCDAEGIRCVGMPQIVDTHKPGAFAVQSFSSTSPTFSTSTGMPTLALRIFRPALETVVELTGSTPHLVRLWKRPRRVLAASGPWSSSGNWWSEAAAWSRDEWDVALKTVEGVAYFRIYRDRISERWFVEGMFD
jgi:protein ImuB